MVTSAVIVGRYGAAAEIELSFGYADLHPVTGKPLREWVRDLPSRRWDGTRKVWIVDTESMPPGTLKKAGFTVVDAHGRPVKRTRVAERSAPLPTSVDVPEWFGLCLDPYQRDAALAAVSEGRTLLADAPGLGKTRQALAALAILAPRRALILHPPVVSTHWLREVEASGIAPAHLTSERNRPVGRGAHTHDNSMPGGEPTCVAIRAGRKLPELPDRGVVLVADSLVAARKQLLDALTDWAPDAVVYDEAHRARTWTSKRSRAARQLAAVAPRGRVIALTGTPMLKDPDGLVPILAMTGHLDTVFGGRAAFLARYTRRNRYKAVVARKAAMPELGEKLRSVWVRRSKDEVMADLPPKRRSTMVVDVDRTRFNAAHAEVQAHIDEWLDECGGYPDSDDIRRWCGSNVGLISTLRVAAGVSKAPAAAEYVEQWTRTQPDRPLVVWAHHREVVAEIVASLPESVPFGVIQGGVSASKQAELVDAFQAGELAALICSITAAGVGITLTRSSDALFVETDWTPALVAQAEDRIHRIGQVNHVIITTMVAEGTLDGHVHSVLNRKAELLDVVVPGDNRVGADAGGVSSAELLRSMVLHRMAEREAELSHLV